MDYTILEVLPGQILVEFEDSTQALVGIGSTHSLAEVDHYVSLYDPDYLPDPATLINPLVSVGDTRTSLPIPEDPPVILEPYPDFSPSHIFVADLVARNGDTTLRDMLDTHVQAVYPTEDLTTAGAFVGVFSGISSAHLAGLAYT